MNIFKRNNTVRLAVYIFILLLLAGCGRLWMDISTDKTIASSNTVQFNIPTSYLAGSGPVWPIVADFDGDGKLDIIVTNSGSNTVSFLKGNGDGTFQNQVTSTTGAGTVPWGAASYDFNGDGKKDLVVADFRLASTQVVYLQGNGNGTFAAPVDLTVGTEPYFVIAQDMNNDGKEDIMVSNSNSNNVSFLKGNGNGTFQAAVNSTTGGGTDPYGMTVGLFNADANYDVIVGNGISNNIAFLAGVGNGTFAAPVNTAVGTTNAALPTATGDFNGDGKLDLAVSTTTDGLLEIFLGNGDGTFQAPTIYNLGGTIANIMAFDFNNDGIQDLAVASNSSNEILVLLGNGDGTFRSPIACPVGTGPGGLAAGDFNGDGKPDFVTAGYNNGTGNSIYVFIQQ